MHALTIVKRYAFTRPCIHRIEVTLNGVLLVRGNDDALVFLIETQHIHHHPRAAGQLLNALTLDAI